MIVVGANLALAAFVFLNPGSRPAPMPNPNGYDDLVQAGRMLQKAGNLPDRADQWRAFVAQNAPAFKMAQSGLSHTCLVPLGASDPHLDERMGDLSALEKLMSSLSARGEAARLEGRTNDSIESYLECVAVGVQSARGGIISAKLNGIAGESGARHGLEFWTNTADALQCRKIVETLRMIESLEDSAQETQERDRNWRSASLGLRGQISRLLESKAPRQREKDFCRLYDDNRAARRNLMVQCAFRQSELEKGGPPSALSDLVPGHLQSTPLGYPLRSK
jgi:hypothetical protein